jgi:D-alanyl-lipoteichoic acid acyltransferase DltB (MBOAT superfamily)
VFVNMVAVGLWHGTGWTYAAFGALHGVLLVVSVLTLKRRNDFFRSRPGLSRLRAVTGPLLTFHLVALALVVFRASSLTLALEYLSHLMPFGHHEVAALRLSFGRAGRVPLMLLVIAMSAAAMEAVHWASQRPLWRQRFLLAPLPVRWGVYYVGALALLLYGNVAVQKFIYAQF